MSNSDTSTVATAQRPTVLVVVLTLIGAVFFMYPAALRLRAMQAGHTTLAAPRQLLGYSLRFDPIVQQTANGALRASPVENRLAASWGDSQRRLEIMAATARLSESEPSQYVDRTLAWARDRGIIPLPIFAGVTGPLGGFVKCANAESGDAAYTACIFADAGAYGLILVAGHYMQSSADAVREAVEHRT